MKVHYNSQHNPQSTYQHSSSKNTKSSSSKSTTSSSQSKSSGGQKYFENIKKGEVNELKQLLKNTVSDKDEKKKREIVKKVIAYMTLGIDVSKLFSEMCMHSYTNDLIIKKMIYLYLTNYAEQNPEDVVMAINTFRKDCNHKEGKIRGLALRSLCSLRFSGSFDYLMPAIQEALKDLDPYVRKIAVQGCLKVFYVSPETIKNDEDIIETLYKMIRDNDPTVITNAISALQEILDKEFTITTKMIIYLLNRLKEFPEFSQVQILNLTAQYTPKTEQELFDIMNLLDDRLRHSCVSIVLATIKIFLTYTKENPKINASVHERIKAPMITLMTSCEMSGQFEIAYTVLQHILSIVSSGGAQYFQSEYKHFYIKADETSYNKTAKLQILAHLSNEFNIGDMLNELGEYVTDIDTQLARNAIETLGNIALRISEMAVPIVKQLSTFINMKKEYIINQTIIAFKNILRKYPEHFKELEDILVQAIDFVTEDEAKISLFWILGEFGSQLDQSPYILENFTLQEGMIDSLDVKHAFLTTTLKLFVKRPAETMPTLQTVFKNYLGNQDEDIDLRDRAAFYYRAMQNNINEFKQLFETPSEKVVDFTEDDEELKNQDLFKFNTLSVIFQKPASKYIKPYQYFALQRSKEAAEELEEDQQAQKQIDEQQKAEEELAQKEQQQQQQEEQKVSNLLDDDIEPVTQDPSQQQQQQQDPNNWNVPQQQTIVLDNLVENYEYDPDEFENQWETLDEGATFTRMLNQEAELEEQQLEDMFKYFRIYSVATGEEDGQVKFYMYSKHLPSNQMLFIEADFNSIAKTVSIMTKCQDDNLAVSYSKYVEELMKYTNLLQQ